MMMGLKYTPKSNQETAPDFSLQGIDGRLWTFAKAMGPNGLVVMFICNHCPYVKSIRKQLVIDAKDLMKMDVNVVTIMSNDSEKYPDDSFENMQQVACDHNFPFPYLFDETQEVARAYGAVCTPDIFGIDTDGVIKYRGRLNAAGIDTPHNGLKRDLVDAMIEMVETGDIKSEQFPSMGCSIKWKT
jgi:peroxiredoxin